jgi:hypothetical protein
VNLRCYLSSLLRIHRPDCEHCLARETRGDEMRKRLEELNWRTQPGPLKHGDHGAAAEVPDSAPGGFAASPPISLQAKQPKTKIA